MKYFISIACFLFSLSVSAKVHTHIEGMDINSKKARRISFVGQKTVLFFSSIKCPCSNSHMEHFRELKSEFPKTKFVAVNVNEWKEVDSIESYYKKKGEGIEVLWDKDFKIVDQFLAAKTPHVFLLDNKGKIAYHGGVTNSSNFKKATKFPLKNALMDLKEGRSPKKSFARALGCYIPR